jgi:putative SOS response-associated peptidase YedK
MCNLYNVKATSSSLRESLGEYDDLTNGANFDDKIYPDYRAPVLRNNRDDRELALCRWGMPTPYMYVKDNIDHGITNIRNLSSPHWRVWRGEKNRCLVPATSFSEYSQARDPETGKKPLHWFGTGKDEPLFFFAGLWTKWEGQRKANEYIQTYEIFGFLTCEANSVVEPIHPKAMPVILTEKSELDMWMNAPWDIARELQRPLSNNKLVLLE